MFLTKNRYRSICRPLVLLLGLCFGVSLIPSAPSHAYTESISSEALAGPVPNPTPEDITIEPSQMARGTTRTIIISIRDCPSKKFGEANTVIAAGDLNVLKGKGIDITSTQKRGDCEFSAELKVADTALFGPVALTVHYKEGDNDQTKTLIIRIVSEEPTPPGPLVPGLDPQVDVMWSVVPQSVAKDNFGQRVGKLFYCIEVVIGNDTGYDLQIAAVGFQLGPTGQHAETVMKTSKRVAETMQTVQDESLELALSKVPEECRRDAKGDSTAFLRCVTAKTQSAIEEVAASQAQVVASLQNQRDFLATLPPNNPKSRLPTTSYRMARGSIEHGQFWNLRDTSLRIVKALGPLLTGFTPYFHNLNRQRNFAEGINILSNPFEKGIELVFPDETIQQLQRLDEQTLRDGMIIQNNRQIRTRAFIPKDVLRLRKPYRDDPMAVMMALGKLHIIGDLIEYKNRISVTSNPSGEVTPPPTVNQARFVLSLGENTTFNVSGTFLDEGRLESDDPVNIKFGSTSSTEKTASASISITEKAIVGPHTFRLITKGGLVSIPVTLTQPPPEPNPVVVFDSNETPTIKTPDKEFTFTITGKFFQGAMLAVDSGSSNAISLVPSSTEISDGGTKLRAKIRVLDAAVAGNSYHFNITNPQNVDAVRITITVGNQPNLTVTNQAEIFADKAPPAYKKSGAIPISIVGTNLFDASLTLNDAARTNHITVTVVDNKNPQLLKAEAAIQETTPPSDQSDHNYKLVLKNKNGALTEISLPVSAQEDVKISKVEPPSITSSSEAQRLNIKISGSNLRQTTVTLPQGWAWQEPANEGAASRHQTETGEVLTLDVVVPANAPPGKASITVKNTTNKIEERKIDILAPPAPPVPTITGFQVGGADTGTAAVGATLVIVGQNLKGATAVTFGQTPANLVPANVQDGKITVVIPSVAGGATEVTVTTTPGVTAKKSITITAP